MNEELLERLGQLIDKADNYLEYPKNKYMAIPMRMDALTHGLMEIRAEILAVYLEAGGEDHWAGRDLP